MTESGSVTRIGHHRLVSRPAYRLITLRDIDNDAGVGTEDALRRSYADVVAASDYELFVQCVQDLVPVTVDIEVWSGEPVTVGGSPARVFTVEFPSGTFVLGSPTGAAIDGELPEGPGYYVLDVGFQGREGDGVECCLIRLWRTGDLPDDDEEWD
ncbi:hypothetical protein ABZ816_01525 [Actinosynnema sp. NPDC047251]|uniref:Uncharacterized protein n=1 Tax=Saccharothrix espanaensis (strain ATCC 51144 / DSM 44229 / JCM 9112 / NBRC 15066 / NRRL 15764) TaxID=1179773 RepID=K0JXR3_SACES|nr:hypothetical protein [Saccharothrix espanaensis]CCH30931.1 hypothetical protein BN6_36360 [Saccharothrix espanaensis DSM 44229]